MIRHRAALGLLACLVATSAAGQGAPRTSTRVLNLPPVQNPVGTETLYLDGPNFTIGRSMTLSALAAYLAGLPAIPRTPIALSGSASIPLAARVVIDAAPGSSLLLPVGAPPGTEAVVNDRQGTASPTLPITVRAPFDAVLLEQSPYTLTVPNESMGFRKTADGAAWQPF